MEVLATSVVITGVKQINIIRKRFYFSTKVVEQKYGN